MRWPAYPHGAASNGLRVDLQASVSTPCLAVPEVLLVSALRNLLDNALRHSPEPGSVVLRIEQLPGQAEFCVLDEGPGMSPAELAQAAQLRLPAEWRCDTNAEVHDDPQHGATP